MHRTTDAPVDKLLPKSLNAKIREQIDAAVKPPALPEAPVIDNDESIERAAAEGGPHPQQDQNGTPAETSQNKAAAGVERLPHPQEGHHGSI